MVIYAMKKGYRKGNKSTIPNMFAFTFIRGFLTNKEYEDMRREYFINNLNNNQVSKAMSDIKWLFKEYKGLDIVTIEDGNGDVNKFIL